MKVRGNDDQGTYSAFMDTLSEHEIAEAKSALVQGYPEPTHSSQFGYGREVLPSFAGCPAGPDQGEFFVNFEKDQETRFLSFGQFPDIALATN